MGDIKASRVVLVFALAVVALLSVSVFAATFTPPSEPQNFTASAGKKKVQLTWDPPLNNGGSPVTAYKLYRSTSPGSERFLLMLSGSASKYTDEPLRNGITYYYKISAVNDFGEGPLSAEVNATPARPPQSPRKLAAHFGNSNVTLTWAPPYHNGGSAITSYNIYQGTNPQNLNYAGTTSNLSYTSAGLTNGVTYYFKVGAVNSAGEGKLSRTVSATPVGPPSEPLSVKARGGVGRIIIEWITPTSTNGAPILSYKLYRGTAPGEEEFYMSLSANLSDPYNTTPGDWHGYNDSPLSPGMYYYRVSAVNEGGEGPLSAEVYNSVVTLPGAPRRLTAVSGNNNITLTWLPPYDDGGDPFLDYVIYRGTSPGTETSWDWAMLPGTYTDVFVGPGVTYYYYVRASNYAGEGPPSNEVFAVTGGTPSKPRNVVATPGSGKIVLQWSPPLDDGGYPVTTYQIWRGTSPGSETFLISTGSTTGTDWWVVPGTTYYYTVRAVNEAGAGTFSTEVSATA